MRWVNVDTVVLADGMRGFQELQGIEALSPLPVVVEPLSAAMRALQGLQGTLLSSVALAVRGLQGLPGIEALSPSHLCLRSSAAAAMRGLQWLHGSLLHLCAASMQLVEPRCGREGSLSASVGVALRPPCRAWRALRASRASS